MKQVLAEGEERIFQIGPCFRNQGEMSHWHRPEFTMLEWYEAGIGFEDYIQQSCDLMSHGYEAIGKERGCRYPDHWHIVTVAEAFQEYVGVALKDEDPELGAKVAAKQDCSVTAKDSFETAFFKCLIELVEPAFVRLGGVVLKDYPKSQAALSEIQGEIAKRFELYWDGVELCNGFQEALGADDNRVRYASAMDARKAQGFDCPPEDGEFIAALNKGIPPSCGNALGFDRWLALLKGNKNLDDSVPFGQRVPFKNSL